MSMESIDFKEFVECDNSPFIVFDVHARIVYLNNSAEILLGYVQKQELYELCLKYAPQSYGYKTTTLHLEYDVLVFYAVTVGYRDDEHICIRLYHKPRMKHTAVRHKNHLVLTDINMLLETAITWFQLENPNALSLLVDQDIPPFLLDQNLMSQLLRKCLYPFRSSDSIDIVLRFVAGEYVVIEEKKVPLVQLRISANGRYSDDDEQIESLASLAKASVHLQEKAIILHIPFITLRDK